MVQNVVSARLGPQRHVGQPMTLDRTPSQLVRAAPRRGEHTEEVLGELGLAPGDIAQMKARGVF
jgi:crotonobetainyl-CoA:carnitine CoA-transferase CaiB-like acyl-CoA transferase